MTRRTAIGMVAPALLRGAGATDGIKALLDTKKPLTWVSTGDSITHGASHTLGWRSYPEHLAERIRWEMRRGRDMGINTGGSGDPPRRMMPGFEARGGGF